MNGKAKPTPTVWLHAFTLSDSHPTTSAPTTPLAPSFLADPLPPSLEPRGSLPEKK